jgi:hypothetical protein
MSAGITSTLPGFPLVNQLGEATADGQPDENARMNCVPASIAAALDYYGHPTNGDALKDAAYGQGSTGPESAVAFEKLLAGWGFDLAPVGGSQAALVATIHREVGLGHPVLVTMPSQWGIAPADPLHPQGYTHVGVACGVGPGMIRVMNPWGGFWQDEADGWWQARLCFGQVWPIVERAGAIQMAGVPTGWKDDGAVLTAPNGQSVRLGFRTYILAHSWYPLDVPLGGERGITGGTQQDFKYTSLTWTQAAGVLEHDRMDMLSQQIAQEQRANQQLQQQLDALAKAQQQMTPDLAAQQFVAAIIAAYKSGKTVDV